MNKKKALLLIFFLLIITFGFFLKKPTPSVIIDRNLKGIYSINNCKKISNILICNLVITNKNYFNSSFYIRQFNYYGETLNNDIFENYYLENQTNYISFELNKYVNSIIVN